jgi:hypothetical protein
LNARSKLTETEKARQVKSNVKSLHLIFVDLKGFLTKSSSWKAKESVLHTTMAFHGDCMEMCENFTLNFGNRRTGCCFITMHHFTLSFHLGIFLPNAT